MNREYFAFRYTFVFQPADQGLQRVDGMGPDVRPDEDEHDIITHPEQPFVDPDADIVYAFHGPGFGNSRLNLFFIAGKGHAGKGGQGRAISF